MAKQGLQKTLTDAAAGFFNKSLKSTLRETLALRGFGLSKIALLFFVSPSVIKLDEKTCIIKIPLNRRTRNHLRSLYFGTLCIGADCAGGLMAMRQIKAENASISLVFKDFKAEFLKRAEGDTYFTCEDGEDILRLVQKSRSSGERENMTVRVTATVPSKLGNEPVARFELTLSLKKRA